MFSLFSISGSALTAEKLRLDVISANLANINTTRSADGGPYKRRTVVFAEQLSSRMSPAGPGTGRAVLGGGVRVEAIYADRSPPQQVFDPEHPDADENGYVSYPNIELVREITDMITAVRSYEANVTAVNTAKSIYLKALEIGR